MTDLFGMGIAMLVGALLGVFFFGGLWWTIQKGMASNWAALWFIGSLLLRTTAVMEGLYFVSQHHWSRFVTFVVGFLLARFVTVKWLGHHPDTAKRCPVRVRYLLCEAPEGRVPRKRYRTPFLPRTKQNHHEA